MKYKEAIKAINDFGNQFSFFELSVHSYSNSRLVIVGSPDMEYYHNIEIHLFKPIFVSCKMSWIVDPQSTFIKEPDLEELVNFNRSNRIEVGYQTVKFIDQDGFTYYLSFHEIEFFCQVVKYQ